MITIALCDDDYNEISKYTKLILGIAKKHKLDIKIIPFYSGESLLLYLSDTLVPIDIIYLDIMMNKNMDGMEAARRLRKNGCRSQIIFLTSYEDYVFDAFEVNALQYLLKDNYKNKFESVFLKSVENVIKKEEKVFSFESAGKTIAIPIRLISYFEIWKRRITIHYDKGKTSDFYASMESLEYILINKGFVRVHRSYIVNLSYIAIFQKSRLHLKNGEEIPVGVTYSKSLKIIFSEYLCKYHIYSNNSI